MVCGRSFHNHNIHASKIKKEQERSCQAYTEILLYCLPIEENSTHMHWQNKCTPYNVSFYVYLFCSLFIAKQNMGQLEIKAYKRPKTINS